MFSCYDREGLPITMERATELHGDFDYVKVARTTVTDLADLTVSFDVSTVWLGFDHAFGGLAPIIFETMVFQGSFREMTCDRYSTEAQALAGHTAMVVTVAATLANPLVMDVWPEITEEG